MAQSVSIWTRRPDLIFEGSVTLDASGNWSSPKNDLPGPDGSANITQWYSSAGIGSLRVAAYYDGLSVALNSFSLQESSFWDSSSTPVPYRNQEIPVTPYPGYVYAELDLTARFFQLLVDGGASNANGQFELTIRAIPL